MQTTSAPNAGPTAQKNKLPRWVFPVASLLAITLLLAFAIYKIVDNFTGLAMFGTALPLLVFAYFFGGVAGLVLAIAWAIYVFNWMRETRVLLRQIEANTRGPGMLPKAPEQKSQSAWPTPPKPLVPPAEDAKYMPKGG